MTAHSSATNRTTSQEIYIQIGKIGNVAIAGAQRTPLKVTELVEQEQRMVAGAAIGCAMGTIPLTPQHIELYIKIFTSGHRKPSSLGK